MKEDLLVISDGNGVDTDFKKWPFYLSLLLNETTNVVNKSVIGSSNEMMYMQLAETLHSQKISKAIVQWTAPNRADFLVDDFWAEQAKIDPVYHFNIVELSDQQWWVTSASKNPFVKEYHSKYVKYLHSVHRSQAWMIAAAELLKSHNVEFCFSLCYNFSFIDPTKNQLLKYPWVWHSPNRGLSEFRMHSKYKSFDTGLPRPHTLIQLDWIDKVLQPSGFISYNANNYYQLESDIFTACSK